MADHLRQQIREAIVAAVTGLASTGARVHDTRTANLEAGGLPALVVFAGGEESEFDVMSRRGSRGIARVVDITVAGYAKANAGVEDVLDTIAKEIEVALAADATLGGLAKDLGLAETSVEFDGDADKVYGRVDLTYRVQYRTIEGDPTTAA